MQSGQFQLHAEIEERHWWFRGRRRIVDVGCRTRANIASLTDISETDDEET